MLGKLLLPAAIENDNPTIRHLPSVTKQLIEARCNIELQTKGGETALQTAQRFGHTAIATLIRNTKHKGAVRAMKNTTQQASPEKIKKQQEDADRAMRELLEEDEKEKNAAAAAGSQKKSNKKKNKPMRYLKLYKIRQTLKRKCSTKKYLGKKI